MDADTVFYLVAITFVCIVAVYWIIRDVWLTKADQQQYVWYKRASFVCCLTSLFLVASHYILTAFFPNNLPEKIISIAISACAIVIIGYRSWPGFREKRLREQLLK